MSVTSLVRMTRLIASDMLGKRDLTQKVTGLERLPMVIEATLRCASRAERLTGMRVVNLHDTAYP